MRIGVDSGQLSVLSVGVVVRVFGVGAEVEALHEALELFLWVRLGGHVGRVVLAVDLVAHELVFIDAVDDEVDGAPVPAAEGRVVAASEDREEDGGVRCQRPGAEGCWPR